MPPPSFLACYCRADTRLLLCFMALFNLKSSFYIATFASQSAAMFYPPTAESLADTFNFAFPVGGFCTSVVASILLEKLGDREDLYMTLVVLLAIIFGIYNLLPYAASQFASALLFGPTRTLQWACYFHFLSLPKRYPPQYVGRLLGYGNLAIALIGDVPLSFLNAFVLYSEELASPAARYLIVHFALQIGLIGCLALPWYLHRQRIAASVPTALGGSASYASAMDDDFSPAAVHVSSTLSSSSGGGGGGGSSGKRSATRTASDDAADDDDDAEGGRGVELSSISSSRDAASASGGGGGGGGGPPAEPIPPPPPQPAVGGASRGGGAAVDMD